MSGEPGTARALDREIAEKVFGLTVWSRADALRAMPSDWGDGYGRLSYDLYIAPPPTAHPTQDPWPLQHYATLMEDTEDVIAWLATRYGEEQEAGYSPQLHMVYRAGYSGPKWLVGWQVWYSGRGWEFSGVFPLEEGDTLPLAVCRAAVRAGRAASQPNAASGNPVPVSSDVGEEPRP